MSFSSCPAPSSMYEVLRTAPWKLSFFYPIKVGESWWKECVWLAGSPDERYSSFVCTIMWQSTRRSEWCEPHSIWQMVYSLT